MNFPYKIIFVKTIVRIAITITFLLFAEVFWVIIFTRRRKKGLSERIISTFIIIMENLNSGLLVQITDSVICEKINEKYYLSKDVNLLCSGDTYIKWVSIQIRL